MLQTRREDPHMPSSAGMPMMACDEHVSIYRFIEGGGSVHLVDAGDPSSIQGIERQQAISELCRR